MYLILQDKVLVSVKRALNIKGIGLVSEVIDLICLSMNPASPGTGHIWQKRDLIWKEKNPIFQKDTLSSEKIYLVLCRRSFIFQGIILVTMEIILIFKVVSLS